MKKARTKILAFVVGVMLLFYFFSIFLPSCT
ncbi:hypothetical protein SAMN04487901_10633 [Prevotella communis]|uniref:Uncharacterized protein n=1 Tax=Prevotella communis TaxID=2913614 RepID=A0A1G7VLL3_9BACT|nr:hypothetical protein SAMN04487901_10633 [Prevotella communis]